MEYMYFFLLTSLGKTKTLCIKSLKKNFFKKIKKNKTKQVLKHLKSRGREKAWIPRLKEEHDVEFPEFTFHLMYLRFGSKEGGNLEIPGGTVKIALTKACSL